MEEIRDLRKKQFFMVDDEYLNGYAKLCGIIATGVYISMCRHSNKEQKCFPSKKLIAEELAISERSIYSAINELSKWNIISIEEQGRKEDGSFKVKIYTLLDKKHWKPKPQANCAVGKKQHSPQANDDTDRRQLVPNKETHIEGNTYKETHKQKIPFETFWETYQKKIDRPKCEKKWKNLSLAEQNAVLEYIPKYLATIKDKQFQKYPATFLNNRSWENEIDDTPKYKPNEVKYKPSGMVIYDPQNIASWSDMKIIEEFGIEGIKKYRGDDFKF